jgi:hypothetical protein
MGKLIGNAKEIVWSKCGLTRIMSGNESSTARTRWNRDADISRVQRGCGLDAATDCSRTRSLRGHGLFASWTRSRTGHGHGQEAGLWRGNSASKPRLLRGRKNLVQTRGRACPPPKPIGESQRMRQRSGSCARQFRRSFNWICEAGGHFALDSPALIRSADGCSFV